MRALKKIEEEIKSVEEQLKKVKGTETEVYTRIVGYLRAVNNWNKGKRREYNERITFDFNKVQVNGINNNTKIEAQKMKEKNTKKEVRSFLSSQENDSISYYHLFYTQFCHNCPPVKEFMQHTALEGEEIDVSSDLGLNIAQNFNIMSTPAVLFFNKEKEVVKRANSVEELEQLFSIEPIAANF